MRPKSLCMHYFFVDVLMHSTNNVSFYVVRQCIYKKKRVHVCTTFFVDVLTHSTNSVFFMQCASTSTKKWRIHKLLGRISD